MPQLNIVHRAQIQLGIQAGKTDAQIARELGVHRGTVGREINRNGGRENYDLWQAQSARDTRQRKAVKARLLFGGGVLFNSKLRKLGLKYAHLSHTHIHWYDYDQDRFFRNSEAWRYKPYKARKTNAFLWNGSEIKFLLSPVSDKETFQSTVNKRSTKHKRVIVEKPMLQNDSINKKRKQSPRLAHNYTLTTEYTHLSA
ncbi:hypothetical protein FUAX_39290 (plasmid) [Fulvitalea axinellae]|uniref:Transposase IS30-like HTH domain-containing protein n=1 Tax=Fulvitalea axinellae TaxID=1182444 RepID=A0AAU9D1E9_9BACT|nr:hypothetical protein FUAX_39290 [Fulvitalea axinellae]